MHTLVSDPPHTVFIKTAKGHEEITQRLFGLNTRQRRVLIVMDGVKTVSSLREVMPREELDEIILQLAEQGFIERASTDARILTQGSRPPKPQSAQHRHVENRDASRRENEPAQPQELEKIRQVKDFMTTTATTYLGLLSADVIHRIERAKGAAQLMTVVGHWHMALRESKQGSRFAGPYLEQVTLALAGSGTQSESHHA